VPLLVLASLSVRLLLLLLLACSEAPSPDGGSPGHTCTPAAVRCSGAAFWVCTSHGDDESLWAACPVRCSLAPCDGGFATGPDPARPVYCCP